MYVNVEHIACEQCFLLYSDKYLCMSVDNGYIHAEHVVSFYGFFFFHADIKNASLELLETNVVLRLITIAQGVYFHVPWKVHWNF